MIKLSLACIPEDWLWKGSGHNAINEFMPRKGKLRFKLMVKWFRDLKTLHPNLFMDIQYTGKR